MNSKLEDEIERIQEIQEDHQDEILSLQNVVGLGVASKVKKEVDTGKLCLSVFVSQKLDDGLRKQDKVRSSIKNIQTDVVETGVIFAGQGEAEPERFDEEGIDIELLRERVRPARGGYSIGHTRVTAGTYATAVYDASAFPGIPRKFYILSNNHVMANSNDARIGDAILQPGPYDGGTAPRDIIARLSRFIPIRFGGAPNYVDAAIAEGPFHKLDRDIYWIGYVRGAKSPGIGMRVQKTGRTTNYTTGTIKAINATVNVNYGGGRVARFVRQIMTTNMSSGGDSGSLLLDLEQKAVGLLFAGSSSVTIHNDIRYVQRLLGIRIA